MMRTLRGCATVYLILALSGATLVSVAIGDAGACAMCARRCCCKPGQDDKTCRMMRPCSGSESGGAVTAGQSCKGVLDGDSPSTVRPAIAGLLRSDGVLDPPGIAPAPPVPPPRTSRA